MARQRENRRTRAQFTEQTRPEAADFLSHSDANENEDSYEDSDAPRVAQWLDDEKERSDDLSSEEGDDNASNAGPSRRLQSLQDDLSALPLGALRSAQRSLAQAQMLSDSESDSEEPSEADFSVSEEEAKAKDEDKRQPFKLNHGSSKRSNKHAPTEITSKRPVSRRRIVVDDNLPKPRDPRFMLAAGRYDPSKFKRRYEFLSGLHNDELATLREHMKRARKLLANSPSHLRAEREQEVQRLERALKKAESAVNQDNRERVEREALQSAKQAEKDKRKKGKAGWWMKRSEQKELLKKARLDAIASVGGKQAVKKALEKKQRKVNQKEKRMRPFSKSEGPDWSIGKKRRPAGPIDTGGAKRRKVS